MSAVVEENVKEKVKKETVKRKKTVKKPNNSLAAIYGLLKGKIFYDDDVFGFAI